MLTYAVRLWLLACLVPAISFPAASAQTPLPDGGIVGGTPAAEATPESEAWAQLQNALDSRHEDTRIQALSALSLLGGNSRAERMVRKTLEDTAADVDVRVAAIVAAGQMDREGGSHLVFRNELRQLLHNQDPKLSFTAANTLWTLHDRSGADILGATAEGERAGDYSFMRRSEHNASRTLHSPEALAKIALLQGLTIFVPPIGMGMGAYGYLKGDPGVSPQVTAIEQLAKTHTPVVLKILIEASKTKSEGARIAAAEALSRFSGPAVHDALFPMMEDGKLQVRLTASAAFLNVSSGARKTRQRQGR